MSLHLKLVMGPTLFGFLVIYPVKPKAYLTSGYALGLRVPGAKMELFNPKKTRLLW